MFSKAGARVQRVCKRQLCAIALAQCIHGVKAGMPWFVALLDNKSCFSHLRSFINALQSFLFST